MPNQQKHRLPSTPLLAAVIPLLALPLSFGLFFISLPRNNWSEWPRAWEAEGTGKEVVLLAMLGVTLACCVLAYVGVSRRSSILLAAIPLATGMTLLAVFNFTLGVRDVSFRIHKMGHSDQHVGMMFQGLSELLTVSAFGMACSAALFCSLALVCLVGFKIRKDASRSALILIAVMFQILAILFMSLTSRVHSINKGFEGFASVVSGARTTLSEPAIAKGASLFHLSLFMGLVLVCCFYGAVMLNRTPRLARLFSALGLIGLLGPLAYALSIQYAGTRIEEVFRSPRMIEISGHPAEHFDFAHCLDATGMVSCERRAPLRQEALFEKQQLKNQATNVRPASLGILPQASTEGLWAFAEVSLSAGMSRIELVGSKPTPPLYFNTEFVILKPLFQTGHSLIELGLVEEKCLSACEVATVKNGALVVHSEVWEPGPPGPIRGEVLLSANRTWSPEQIISFASAAAARGRRLVLALGATHKSQ